MKNYSTNIHLLTLNVQGVRDKNKQARLFQWGKQQKANILFLQETHITNDIQQNFDRQFNGTVAHSPGTSNSRGVAILIHSSINHKVLNTYNDVFGRILILNVEIDAQIYSLINVYAPNNPNDRNSFFKQTSDKIAEYAQGTILLGGDFNEILDPKLDQRNRTNIIPKRTKASNSLGNLCKTHKLIDIWRNRNKKKKQFTWKRHALNEASRIDYFLIQNDLELNTVSCDIRPAQIGKTTHLAVSIKFKYVEETRVPGFCKINNSLLRENEYQDIIIKTIETTKLSSDSAGLNPHDIWETIKCAIKEATQLYSKQRAKRVANQCHFLENKLSELHEQQDNSQNINRTMQNDILKIENELNKTYDYKAKGAQIRSRAEWIENGEKSTKYFLSLEKIRQNKKNIRKLTSADGRTLTQPSDILKEQVNFYSNLYSSTINDTEKMKAYFDSTHLTHTLGETDRELCDINISNEDCKNSLFSMKLNKSPGSDGLSVEFYQAFWKYLSPLFMNALNESLVKGQLTDTQTHGTLSLIFKSGEETNLNNWRPITLLNVDYKIIANS